MPNIFRKLLARKIRNNGGYRRWNEPDYPIEYTVGLYYADLELDHMIEMAIKSEHLSAEQAATPGLREYLASHYNAEKAWEWGRDDACQSLDDNDCYRSYGPEVAARYGMPWTTRKIGFTTPERRTAKIWPHKRSSIELLIKGSCTDIPYFDVEFGLAGRGGKHLVVTEFEGVKLIGRSSEMLAEDIEEEHSGLSNRWCHYLLAMMSDWERWFTSKKASAELEYQVSYRVAEIAVEFLDEQRAIIETAEIMHL